MNAKLLEFTEHLIKKNFFIVFSNVCYYLFEISIKQILYEMIENKFHGI